jgi:hypothetical protein
VPHLAVSSQVSATLREPPSQLHHLASPRREQGRRRPRRGSARPRRRREPGLRSISSLSPSLRYALSLSLSLSPPVP